MRDTERTEEGTLAKRTLADKQQKGDLKIFGKLRGACLHTRRTR
jgi:hypothetical protein